MPKTTLVYRPTRGNYDDVWKRLQKEIRFCEHEVDYIAMNYPDFVDMFSGIKALECDVIDLISEGFNCVYEMYSYTEISEEYRYIPIMINPKSVDWAQSNESIIIVLGSGQISFYERNMIP